MTKEQEWKWLCEEYGEPEMLRWFYSFKGYCKTRESNTFEQVKDGLEGLGL